MERVLVGKGGHGRALQSGCLGNHGNGDDMLRAHVQLRFKIRAFCYICIDRVSMTSPMIGVFQCGKYWNFRDHELANVELEEINELTGLSPISITITSPMFGVFQSGKV